jgi:hypothetical protein
MSTKDEAFSTERALKLALEALEYIDREDNDREDNDRDFLFPFQCAMLDKAITAIKQALAAPVQEPVARQYQGRDGVWKDFISEKHYKDTLEDGSWPIRALYTTPPAPVLPHCEHDFKMSPSYGGYLCAVCGKPERRK